jgi:hypothetical protein
MCFSSPVVKLSISSLFLMSTVPFVSLCATSSALVYTATLAPSTFVTSPSGSRPKTMPCTTREAESAPPMIFTTRTLSTLNAFGSRGMTASAASATSAASVSSYPYCLDAIAGRSAPASAFCVIGDGRLVTARSVTGYGQRAPGAWRGRALSSSSSALAHASS